MSDFTQSKIIKPPSPPGSQEWVAETGPLQIYLSDPTVSEIMVNGPRSIFVERNGQIERAKVAFNSIEELNKVVLSIARAAGKELSRKSPCLDARLSDGSRVNIVVQPVAVDGPLLTIRKARPVAFDLRNLVHSGFFDEKCLYFLNVCVVNRVNILVSGGTSSGKTTLLNALLSLVPKTERLVTIEDTLELIIKQENVARMEARGSSAYDDGIEAVELIKNALRMRPDRIIVGECRGPEAWDMLQAMNSGHEGSMSTVHSNSARDALRRIESLVLIGEAGSPSELARSHIGGILNVVIQVERDPVGKRYVSEIAEVTGFEGGEIRIEQLFRRDQSKGLRSCGRIPQFYQNSRRNVLQFPPKFFDEDHVVTLEGFGKK